MVMLFIQQSILLLKAGAGEDLNGSVASCLISGPAASAALEVYTFQKLFLIFSCLEPLELCFPEAVSTGSCRKPSFGDQHSALLKMGLNPGTPHQNTPKCGHSDEKYEIYSSKVLWHLGPR